MVRPVDSSKWQFYSNDKLKTQSLLEWGVTSMPLHDVVVLRLGYAVSQHEWDVYQRTDRSPHQIQVAMSAADARELSTQLLLYAELLDMPSGMTPNGG